jgi:hypothetical protein
MKVNLQLQLQQQIRTGRIASAGSGLLLACCNVRWPTASHVARQGDDALSHRCSALAVVARPDLATGTGADP